MATVASLRQLVRETLDCDDSVLSDFLLDEWLDEAAVEVHSFTDWPWLDTIWELSTASTYTDFSEIVDADSYIPKRIVHILQGDKVLRERTSDALRDALASWGDSTGTPSYWAQRGGRTLILGPTPSEAATFTIRGFRARKDFVSDGAAGAPDMPADVQPALSQWMLFKAYQWADDPQSSMHYFDLHLRTLQRYDQSVSGHASPTIIGGGEWRRDRDANVSGYRASGWFQERLT